MMQLLKRQGLLFCILGPTGGGKTTFAKRLCEEYRNSVKLSTSATSRAPRGNEQAEGSYIFLSRNEFEAKIASNEFFEWAEVHGNLYGTFLETITTAIDTGIDLILDIDIQGALRFKDSFRDNTITLFMMPPSLAVQKERLEKRCPMSEEEWSRRLQTAQTEYAALTETDIVDYLVINDELDATYQIIVSILSAESAKLARYAKDSIMALCKIDE